MTELQKVIKYLAMALAIFIAVGIVGGILGVIGLIAGSSSLGGETLAEGTVYTVSGDITDLKMELGAAELTVVTGESFSVESNLKDLKVEEKKGTLIITEKTRLWKNYSSEASLILTVPEGFSFGSADITTGAGKVTVEALSADRLSLEFGAGDVKIAHLNAAASADIDGGAGRIEIGGGSLRDLSLDMGVGAFELTSTLSGECDLDYGIGDADLNLIGTADDYRISVDKGVGAVTIDGANVGDDTVYGSGGTEIDIDSGIGKVDIKFKEK